MGIVTPKVFNWREDLFVDWENEVNTNNIIECCDWINKFSGVNRLSNDVSLPLERCVVGSYQIGYLPDYYRITDVKTRITYLEEGIASVLLHMIATYEMMDNETILLFKDKEYDYKWNKFCDLEYHRNYFLDFDFEYIYHKISEYCFKFNRWILYNHMKRTKRWSQQDFENSLYMLIKWCCVLSYKMNCELSLGFAMCMEKLQDQEIKRH